MKKLAKVNKYEGKIQAIVKNLLTVGGKNIAVPVDVPINGEVGDTIRIEYNDQGFLTKSELVKKGEPEPEKKEPVVQAVTKMDKEIEQVIEKGGFKEVEKFTVDPVYKNNIIVLQTCYNQCCQTVREQMINYDTEITPGEMERVHKIAVDQAKVDALALLKIAGEMR